MSDWISVNSRLPKVKYSYSKPCIVVMKNSYHTDVAPAQLYHTGIWLNFDGMPIEYSRDTVVTHWMLMPKPPQAEDK